MMSISFMGAGSADYYLSLAREDYYLKGGEPPGIWWGDGAKALKLSGQVRPHDFHALFRGFAPEGNPLVQNAGKEDRQPGWDLTLSAPKSVSTLWSQGDETLRREIQAAHLEAVTAALAYFQEELELTRRGEAGSKKELAGLVVGLFEHATSRELDPNLHTHALVLNVCTRQDGSSGAVLSKPIYQHKMVAGALYRTELAAQLESRLAVRCCLAKDAFAFTIEGVMEALNKVFSKRRGAVEERLKSRGLESAAAAAAATFDTRREKGEIPPRADLFTSWKAIGRQFGFTPAQALGRARRKLDDLEEFKKALAEALDRITSSESHFTEGDLMQVVAVQAQGRCLSGRFVRKQVHDALEHDREIRPLAEWQGEARYTTRSVLAAERELIAAAGRLNDQHEHGASDAIVANAIRNSARPLTKEQEEAVWHLANKQSGFRALEGLAGTGKTSTLAVVREALEKAGYHVLGATISAKAARELQEGAGIKSHSTAGVEFRMEPPLRFRLRHHLRQMYRAIRQKPTFKLTPLKFDERTVLVLDEAAMIPTKELALLAGAVEEAGGMLITVFDRKQLQAIGPGGGAAFLADRYGKANLTNIVRQKNPMDVEFVRAFASGNAKEAIEKLEKRGLLHVAKDRASAMARLVADWTDADFGKRERALIFVGTRAEVADANARCQKARLRAGELRGHAYTHRGRTFYERDRVVFTKNSTKLGVENSAFGTIVELKRLRGIAMIKMDTGETLPIPLRRFKGYKGLELGYAVTTHKGQGTTVDSAYLLVGGKMQDRELTYVQASRARLSTRVYTDQHEAGENLFQLAKQMEKSHQKTLAHAVVADSKRGHGAGRLKKTNGDRREALARDAAAQQEREMEALRLKIRLGI